MGRSGAELVKRWIQKRLLRRPYRLWSPLSPDWVAMRLTNNFDQGNRLFWQRPEAPCRGRVDGWSVHLSAPPSLGKNPGRIYFAGDIATGGSGSWLTGSIGPNQLWTVFSIVGLGGTGLLLILAVVSVVSTAIAGHPGSWSLLLITMAIFTAMSLYLELVYRISASEWQAEDLWLRQLLQVPNDDPGAESHKTSWSSLRPINAFRAPRRQGTNRSNVPLLVVGLLLIFAVFSGVIMWTGNASESSLGHDLQSHGAQTVGTVAATQPSNHEYFSYTYVVDGVEYSGNTDSFLSATKLTADQLHVGQRIPVIYDSKTPALSCSCDVDQLAGSRFHDTLLSIAIPLSIALVIVLVVRRQRRSQNS
jgi:hypothetical protein